MQLVVQVLYAFLISREKFVVGLFGFTIISTVLSICMSVYILTASSGSALSQKDFDKLKLEFEAIEAAVLSTMWDRQETMRRQSVNEGHPGFVRTRVSDREEMKRNEKNDLEESKSDNQEQQEYDSNPQKKYSDHNASFLSQTNVSFKKNQLHHTNSNKSSDNDIKPANDFIWTKNQ